MTASRRFGLLLRRGRKFGFRNFEHLGEGLPFGWSWEVKALLDARESGRWKFRVNLAGGLLHLLLRQAHHRPPDPVLTLDGFTVFTHGRNVGVFQL